MVKKRLIIYCSFFAAFAAAAQRPVPPSRTAEAAFMEMTGAIREARQWLGYFPPDAFFAGPLPDDYIGYLPPGRHSIPPDPWLPMQDAGFYHEQLPAGVIRIRTCLLAYAALGPVCLWALRRKVFRGGWRRAAASLAAWLPGFAAAAAGAWLHSKALAAGGAWAQVFWGTGAAAGWLAAGAWLASGWLRLYWLRAAAVFLGAAWIAVAGPMELARRFPPERHAVWQDGRNARARFATDGRDAFILVSRGPDGRFDSSPETLRQALQPSSSAAPSGLEALALRAYDPTNGARGGGDWFAAGTADSVRFLGFSAP